MYLVIMGVRVCDAPMNNVYFEGVFNVAYSCKSELNGVDPDSRKTTMKFAIQWHYFG